MRPRRTPVEAADVGSISPQKAVSVLHKHISSTMSSRQDMFRISLCRSHMAEHLLIHGSLCAQTSPIGPFWNQASHEWLQVCCCWCCSPRFFLLNKPETDTDFLSVHTVLTTKYCKVGCLSPLHCTYSSSVLLQVIVDKTNSKVKPQRLLQSELLLQSLSSHRPLASRHPNLLSSPSLDSLYCSQYICTTSSTLPQLPVPVQAAQTPSPPHPCIVSLFLPWSPGSVILFCVILSFKMLSMFSVCFMFRRLVPSMVSMFSDMWARPSEGMRHVFTCVSRLIASDNREDTAARKDTGRHRLHRLERSNVRCWSHTVMVGWSWHTHYVTFL